MKENAVPSVDGSKRSLSPKASVKVGNNDPSHALKPIISIWFNDFIYVILSLYMPTHRGRERGEYSHEDYGY
jgi:hypothetical protein